MSTKDDNAFFKFYKIFSPDSLPLLFNFERTSSIELFGLIDSPGKLLNSGIEILFEFEDEDSVTEECTCLLLLLFAFSKNNVIHCNLH